MCQSPWATLTIRFSPWWTVSSSPSAFRTRADSSLRTWMGALTIRTPAGKAKPYGQRPAHGQCSISRVGRKIGQRPLVFNSARIHWRGERGGLQKHEDTKKLAVFHLNRPIIQQAGAEREQAASQFQLL